MESKPFVRSETVQILTLLVSSRGFDVFLADDVKQEARQALKEYVADGGKLAAATEWIEDPPDVRKVAQSARTSVQGRADDLPLSSERESLQPLGARCTQQGPSIRTNSSVICYDVVFLLASIFRPRRR